MNRNEKSRFLPNSDNLKLITYCPLCNAHFSFSAAKVLEEREDAHLVHIQCQKCSSFIVALILTNAMGISTVGLITDLTSDDVSKFTNSSRLTVNDVIDLYQVTQSGKNLAELLINH
ncbi:MAG: hypothetical protein WC734_00750 [Patescibacteria group bacterium]|jgi:hypothetical protein